MSLTPLIMTMLATRTMGALWLPTPFSSTTAASSFNTTSFVGNTPSTVLFFLAMSVGVAIACLFIFFTVRYFIRSRYGLHVYPVSNRGMFSATFRETSTINYVPSNRELQEHLDYLRTHHFLRDEFLERRILSGSARRRRRRRRGRYSKMKKLTAEEVEKLFPKKLYAEWMRSGDDASEDILLMKLVRLGVVDDSNSDTADHMFVPVSLNKPNTSVENLSDFAVVEIHEMHTLQPKHLLTQEDTVSLGLLLGGKAELHFDSGSCTICLETFEDDDVVRGLICGHVFHSECVDPWFTRRRACCPICKRDYYKEESLDGNTVREDTNDQATEGETDGQTADGVTAEGGSDEILGDNTGATTGEPRSGATDSSANIAGASTATNVEEGTSTRPDVTRTASEATTRTRFNEDDSINFDILRTDPNLQALFQELIPISERVRVILEEHPELDLEARGQQIADRKYSSIWKKIFWKLMGILKDDLYNWGVINTYQEEYQRGNVQQNTSSTTPAQDTAEADTEPQNADSPLPPTSEAAAPASESTSALNPAQSQSATGSSTPSIYHNALEMQEVEVSESLRRDIASRRV